MERLPDEARFFFGPFELNSARRTLCRDGIDLRLAPKEYLTLTVLVRHAGKAVSKDTLLAEVWPGTSVGDTSLARCVSSLRRHLGPDAIQAVPKFGYRFTLPVTTESPAQAPLPDLSPQSSLGSDPQPAAVPGLTFTDTHPATPPAKPRTRRWLSFGLAAGGAVLLLGAVRGPWPLARSWQRPATWTDPQTGLTWQQQDNGVGAARGRADLSRSAALTHCAALQLNGEHDWRLPTIEELQTLHDPSQSVAGLWGGYRPVYWHAKGGVILSGGETASDLTVLTDQTPAGEEQSYDFSFGRRNDDPADFQADHRALCVRKGS